MKYFPTMQHQKAADRMVEIFSKDRKVESILLTCSCARGKACKDSCLDMCIIARNENHIKNIRNLFEKVYKKEKVFRELSKIGKYSHIDLDITDGRFRPAERDWTTGPVEYELKIGNIFAYSKVLFDRNGYFGRLRKKYIPYYQEKPRKERLKEAKKYMNNNLEHIPLYVKRGLYFQAFKRLHDAAREFLQAVFIKNKKYPIAYDKWIKEQLTEILGKPELYREFVKLYEIKKLESDELARKAGKLKQLSRKFLEI